MDWFFTKGRVKLAKGFFSQAFCPRTEYKTGGNLVFSRKLVGNRWHFRLNLVRTICKMGALGQGHCFGGKRVPQVCFIAWGRFKLFYNRTNHWSAKLSLVQGPFPKHHIPKKLSTWLRESLCWTKRSGFLFGKVICENYSHVICDEDAVTFILPEQYKSKILKVHSLLCFERIYHLWSVTFIVMYTGSKVASSAFQAK